MNSDIELTYIQIDIANLPEHQEETYKLAPTTKARKLAKETTSYILNSRDVLPTTVAATIEGGIYLAYIHNNLQMKIEVYNDLTIAGILVDMDNEVILDSLDVYTISDLQILINPLLGV